MPLYDLRCDNPECPTHLEEFEKLCKMGEVPDCETCGAKLTKLIRAPDGPRMPHISWSQWRVL